MPTSGAPPRLRADARRNRDQLLSAARNVFVEQGASAPLDEIARRAGVGIATLYRRFPDRESLLRSVAVHLLLEIAHEARQALDEESTAFAALRRYMHRAIDARVAAVMPALVGTIPLDDDEFLAARALAVEPVQCMIERAQADGSLRADVSFGDIGLVLIRLSRPLPSAFAPEMEAGLAHRHLELFIAGLRSEATELPGPRLGLEELRTASEHP